MATLKISGFPPGISLQPALTINGTEKIPVDQTVGGILQTRNATMAQLLGPISVNYTTGAVVVTPISGIGLSITGVVGSDSLDVTTPVTVGGLAFTGTQQLTISNTSVVGADDARLVVAAGGGINVALFMTNAASGALISGGPTGAQATLRTLGAQPIVFGTGNTYRGQIASTGQWIVQGTTSTDPAMLINGAAGKSSLDLQSADSVSIQLQVVDGGANNIACRVATTNTIGTFGVAGTNAVLALWSGGANRTFQDPNGILYWLSPTPTAVNATATLTIAQLLTLIITSTTAAAVTATLPTGTLTDAGIFGPAGAAIAAPVNTSFDWSVVVTGATNAFTVAAGVGHTLVGSGVVAASTSALFRTQKTATNTFVTYRLAV